MNIMVSRNQTLMRFHFSYFWLGFKSNERSDDSYIGLGNFFVSFFFSGKSLKICSRSVLIFLCLILISSEIQLISIVKRKAYCTIEQQKCQVTKNVIYCFFRKWNLIFRFPSEI